MLRVGASTPPVSLTTASESTKPISIGLRTCKPYLSSFQLPDYTHLLAVRSGFRLFSKKKGSRIELEKEADNFEDDFDDLEGVEDDDDDDDMMIPFEKMDEWMRNKPRGFGEGKVYDTSVEDKLIEEIEQTRKFQLENIEKLKNESQDAKPKIQPNDKELKVSEVGSSDIRVRMSNLPKKKNVHRDLKPAFEGVQGIANISPVVFGNKKTRDPICKGFAFVDFKSSQDANRFVQMFSGQNVAFGKIQKQIKVEILTSDNGASKEPATRRPSNSSEPKLAPLDVELDEDLNIEESDLDEELIDDIKFLSRKQDTIPQPSISGSAMRLKVREKTELSEVFSRSGGKEASISKEIFAVLEDGEDQDPNAEENDPSMQFWEDDDFDEDDDELVDEDAEENIDLVRASDQDEFDNEEENTKFSSALKQDENCDTKPEMKAELDLSSSLKNTEKAKEAKKKAVVKEKAIKTSKPKIPGSARRLKGQDRAKLENVFTKYGTKKALASKDV